MLQDGPVPKHVQLREALLRSMETDLAPGAMLPSERDLMATHGVSRATVRAAIAALVTEGRARKVPGKGTVVTRPRVESQLHLASFTQDMRRRGLRPSTEVTRIEKVSPDEETAAALGLAPTDTVWLIERRRLADDEPMAVETSWYPTDLLPHLDDEDLTGSLYAILETRYGVVIQGAEQTVWTEPVGAVWAGPLGVSAKDPVLVFDRITSTTGRPVERTVSRYRGDRYQLSMRLTRDASTTRTNA